MKRGFYYILLTVITAGLLGSCSTKKNTKASRFYHSFTTRYNIYYNGKVSFDETLNAMQKGYRENYSEQIFMYPISAQPKDKATTGGPFDRAIEKSNKAIKLHSIQVKPEKKAGWRSDPKQVALQSQEEYNPFLKNSWLMLGQAQFYNADFLQASATFSYISRHYATDELVASEARIWQARCYTEMGWFYESEDVLNKLNINGIPKKNLDKYAAVNADLLIKEGKFEESIPYLQTAIKAEKNKLQRTRMKYLLGQLYTSLELDGLAYTQFGQVVSASPPYELEFAARIRQSEVYAGGSYLKEVKKLERMTKSEKNKDLLDQVYYAIGNMYLSRQDTANSIQNYSLGIEKSTRNGLDKAICQIKLGDIYFARRDYIHAQPCYSGALAAIQKEHKDYKRVAKLSEILDGLVVHVQAVHLQDSLQTLARMPEAERLAVIDKIIDQVKKDEEAAKAEAEKAAYLAQQEATNTGINRPGTETAVAMLPTAGTGTFYFYNPQTVAQGKTQFQRLWGRRVLEDNWRRSNKTMSTFGAMEEDQTAMPAPTDSAGIVQEAAAGTDQPDDISNDPKTREFYLQQLPLTPEDVEASNIIIVDGLYQMAMIYKDRLEDLPLSIEGFQTLDNRFPENEHRLESYYQIYLMALRLDNRALADEYKAKLIHAFPASDYAVAIADPDYLYNIRMMDQVQDSVYQRTYQAYLDGNVDEVRKNYRMMNEQYPLAKLMPKFMFLDALTHVQTGDVEGFKATLKALIDKYPEADVTELAGEMLKGVLRGRTLVQGNVRGMTWNMRFGGEGGLSAADSARTFSAETNVPYRMLLIYPTGSLDKNQLLFTVAAFNFANFMVKEFDLNVEENGSVSILSIEGFFNFNEILHYYRMIYGKDGYANALNKEVTVLPISTANYETLLRGKTVDDYIDFFETHFAGLAPEMLARWSAHREADMQEKEEEEAAKTETETGTVKEEAEGVKAEPVTVPAPVLPDSAISPISLPDTTLILPPTVLAGDTLSTELPPVPETLSTPDSVPAIQAPARERDLTLKEIEEIRAREAEAEAIRKAEELQAQQAKEQLLKEQKEQEDLDRATLLKQKKADEAAKEKARKEREKQLERERAAKEKASNELRKQKEREYKERLRLKEKERKQKEAEYQKKLREREKARKK